MRYEFDPAKSAANLAKHGIDFEAARVLWDDPARVRLAVVIRGEEEREIYVGRINEKLWTGVVTRRGDALRIISVRRARPDEAKEHQRGGV